MNASNGVRWTHYEDVPDGDRQIEHFTHWKDLAAAVGIDTLGVTVIDLRPGECGPMHAHDPPIEDVYFVLEGTMDVATPDDAITVEAGTIVCFAPGVPHRPENNGDEPVTALTFRRTVDGSVKMREAE